MASKNDRMSQNTSINIRSKYVLSQPLYHHLLPYHAPPVFPNTLHHVRPRSACSSGAESAYQSIYRNWPQRLDNADDFEDLPGRCVDLPPEFDEVGEDEYGPIRVPKYQALHQRNVEQRQSATEAHYKEAVKRAARASPGAERYEDSVEHFQFVDNRVKQHIRDAERQTAELEAVTHSNTARENEERDEKKKKIRERLFLKQNSPFSSAQSVVASRLEEKLYATSPIDLLIQKNRTRCQYSNLPIIRRLNELAINEEKENRRRRSSNPLNQPPTVYDKRLETMDMSKDLKRAIRGKSATAIGAALYAESMQNIKNSRNVHDSRQDCNSMVKYQRGGCCESGYEDCDAEVRAVTGHHSRASSVERRTIRSVHVEMMDDRALDHMNQNVMNSIEQCRYQLKNFSHTSSDLYAASR